MYAECSPSNSLLILMAINGKDEDHFSFYDLCKVIMAQFLCRLYWMLSIKLIIRETEAFSFLNDKRRLYLKHMRKTEQQPNPFFLLSLFLKFIWYFTCKNVEIQHICLKKGVVMCNWLYEYNFRNALIVKKDCHFHQYRVYIYA